MHLIAYVSHYAGESDTADTVLNDIIIVSKRNNAEIGVTGLLFYMEGKFLQVIEGEEAALRALIDTIKRDDRHDNFEILIDTPVKKRGFNDWNMDEIQLKSGKEYSHDYLQAITSAFKNMMIPQSDTLVDFYRSLLEEEKQARPFSIINAITRLFKSKPVQP